MRKQMMSYFATAEISKFLDLDVHQDQVGSFLRQTYNSVISFIIQNQKYSCFQTNVATLGNCAAISKVSVGGGEHCWKNDYELVNSGKVWWASFAGGEDTFNTT